MSCLNPKLMRVFPSGSVIKKDGSSGSLVEFLGYEHEKNFLLQNGDFDDKKIRDWTSENFVNSNGELSSIFRVPCGQCSECRRAHARGWANRLICEQSLYCSDYAWFITLTYDDNFLKFNRIPDPSDDASFDDEIDAPFPTLVKRDLQLFMKRLRRRLGNDTLRFYAAGEYGSKTARPHYHIILFGTNLFQFGVHPRGTNELGQMHFESLLIDELWPYGMNTVAPSNWTTCYYVASYVTKKLTGKAFDQYKKLGIDPEFSVMSRRPGIAWSWYQSNYDSLSKRYSAPVLGRSYSIDRYGLNTLFFDDPLMLDTVKRFKQDSAEKLVDSLRADSDIPLWKQNADKAEANQLKKTKIFSSV